jgi:hypothetical protein
LIKKAAAFSTPRKHDDFGVSLLLLLGRSELD